MKNDKELYRNADFWLALVQVIFAPSSCCCCCCCCFASGGGGGGGGGGGSSRGFMRGSEKPERNIRNESDIHRIERNRPQL